MVIIVLDDTLKSFKNRIRLASKAQSSHIDQAIASGCGYATYAALGAHRKDGAEGRFVDFNETKFRDRLSELGGEGPEVIAYPPLSPSARYAEKLLADSATEMVMLSTYRAEFRLRGIPDIVEISLVPHRDGGVRIRRSHAFHTPVQIGPYFPSREFDDDPAYAMNRAVESLASYYREAVGKGFVPSRHWLVPID